MKIPPEFKGFRGEVVDGEVVLQNGNGESLQEYGASVDGRHAACYVLTAPGDIVTVNFMLTSGVEQCCDLVVDGILRASAIRKSSSKTQKVSLGYVLHQKVVAGKDKKTNPRKYQMEINTRDASKGTNKSSALEQGFTTKQAREFVPLTKLSAVGSIELQVFQQAPTSANSAARNISVTQRAPNFTEHSQWSDLNPYDDLGKSSPFEVKYVL